jgi:cytochrome bd-type quinol oxidase subunit 2
MDLLTAPIALLIGLGLAGIILPFAASFILDGIVNQIRGRGSRVLIVAAGVTIIIAVVFAVVWQAGLSEASNEASNAAINSATDGDTLSGSLQLVLLFTIPIALLTFGARMLSRYANPIKRAKELQFVEARRGGPD